MLDLGPGLVQIRTMPKLEIFNPDFADQVAAKIENARYVEERTPQTWNEVIKDFRKLVPNTPASDNDLRRALTRFHDAYKNSDSPAQRGVLGRVLQVHLWGVFMDSGAHMRIWNAAVGLQPDEVILLEKARTPMVPVKDADPEITVLDSLEKRGLVNLQRHDKGTTATLRGIATPLCHVLFGS